MNFRYLLILLVLFSFQNQRLVSQSEINGHIIIDTSIWSPIAYLSLISDFDAMNTMSYDMIIDETDIDNSGRFRFDTRYLPAEDNIYRIHISKRNDSPASLIIGGKDDNHFFIIANNSSKLLVRGHKQL